MLSFEDGGVGTSQARGGNPGATFSEPFRAPFVQDFPAITVRVLGQDGSGVYVGFVQRAESAAAVPRDVPGQPGDPGAAPAGSVIGKGA